ncbi:MAG: hypothetical protein JST67_05125 [Bacteroidetes bacterium]|nr:hypothetical protein [Bacteroidota bacterium]
MAALMGTSCKSVTTAPAPSKGSINPTNYVAVGNSITSGFADGALYYNGQLVSYPNLLAQQLKLVGGGNFNQPLMSPSSVGVGSTGNAPLMLGYSTDCLGVTSLAPIPTATVGDVSAFSNNIYAAQGPFNNMGVPGAKVITAAVPGYGNPALGPNNYNPFFTRMAKNPGTSSMLSDAMLQNPSFFSLFLGNNDVLAYASNGGASDFITPQATFAAAYQQIVDSLTKNGAKGVVANIPDITALPFFTTVPWNGLALTRQGQADTLNALWSNMYNFKVGNNPFLIKDPAAPLGQRLINSNELILLNIPLNNVKCHALGSIQPIPNQYVLTTMEMANIQTAISGFNATIKAVAQAKGLAFVDVNAFMQQTVKGISYNGININASFVKGGAFSLDGIHLTPLGNALLANEFIMAINTQYGATIPQLDATQYHGVLFP